MLQTILMLMLSMIAIIWSAPLILAQLFGLQAYKIADQQKLATVMRKLPKRATLLEDDKPKGWVWGMNYIGYILETKSSGSHGSSTTVELYILTTPKMYNSLTDNAVDGSKTDQAQQIQIYDRRGNFFCLEYLKSGLNVENFNAKSNQTTAIRTIIDLFKAQSHVVAILYGLAGTGKSMISLLLAKELNGSLCDTYNPTDPGDTFGKLYSQIGPTKESPLIVVLEEFDILVNKIHKGEILSHKHIPIQIKNKVEYNTFFDRIDRGMYTNLIIVMTSNVAPEVIDSLDPSYIRQGRVDLKIKIDALN